MMPSGGNNMAPTRGVLVYLGLTFVLSWVPAWLLSETWIGEGRPIVTQLLTCSLFYAISMGWQPLAARCCSGASRWT